MTKIFFREDDFVKEGTQEFKDFWKFLLKFQALEKRKAEKEGRDRKRKRTDEVSEILGVPLEANLGHGLNFQLKPKDPAELLNRIPFQVSDYKDTFLPLFNPFPPRIEMTKQNC